MNKYIRLPIIALLVMAILLITVLFANMPSDIISYLSLEGKVVVHCSSCSADAISDGVALQLLTDTNNFAVGKARCSGIMGYSLIVSNTESNLLAVFRDSRVICVQSIEESTLYYCYNPSVLGGVVIDDDVINMQIAVSRESIVVGSPIILGSY